MTRDEILQQALALSEEDRFFLLQKIDSSLPPSLGMMSDDELNAEIERRCEEVERGEAKLIDAHIVLQNLRAKYCAEKAAP